MFMQWLILLTNDPEFPNSLKNYTPSTHSYACICNPENNSTSILRLRLPETKVDFSHILTVLQDIVYGILFDRPYDGSLHFLKSTLAQTSLVKVTGNSTENTLSEFEKIKQTRDIIRMGASPVGDVTAVVHTITGLSKDTVDICKNGVLSTFAHGSRKLTSRMRQLGASKFSDHVNYRAVGMPFDLLVGDQVGERGLHSSDGGYVVLRVDGGDVVILKMEHERPTHQSDLKEVPEERIDLTTMSLIPFSIGKDGLVTYYNPTLTQSDRPGVGHPKNVNVNVKADSVFVDIKKPASGSPYYKYARGNRALPKSLVGMNTNVNKCHQISTDAEELIVLYMFYLRRCTVSVATQFRSSAVGMHGVMLRQLTCGRIRCSEYAEHEKLRHIWNNVSYNEDRSALVYLHGQRTQVICSVPKHEDDHLNLVSASDSKSASEKVFFSNVLSFPAESARYKSFEDFVLLRALFERSGYFGVLAKDRPPPPRRGMTR
jgi:hypothetical protein